MKKSLKIFKTKRNFRDQHNTLDTEITEQEIIKTAMKLKLKKAAYSDKINNEMIKSSADIQTQGFVKLFNIILNSGKFPELWCEGLITSIFKSGNKLDPNNYRGICVSSSLGNFFCLTLNDRQMNYTKQQKLFITHK